MNNQNAINALLSIKDFIPYEILEGEEFTENSFTLNFGEDSQFMALLEANTSHITENSKVSIISKLSFEEENIVYTIRVLM